MITRSITRPIASPIARAVTAAYGGYRGPSLTLDFAAQQYAMGPTYAPPQPKTFAELVTFTRASGGGRFNDAGQYEWLANNVARFDYDPVTLQSRGLLVEEQRTNLLTESEFRNGVTDAVSRSGLLTATPFSGFAGGLAFGRDGATLSYAYKSATGTVGNPYTLSILVRMDDGGAPVVGAETAGYDFTLVMEGSVAGITSTVVNLGNGLYRVSGTKTAATGSINYGVVKYTSNSARTFKVTGYQLEAGSFPTSYIPTTTAQVTRAASDPLIPALSPWFNSSAGTFVIEHDAPSGRPLLSSGASLLASSAGVGRTVLAYDAAGSYLSQNGAAYVAGPALTFDTTLRLMRSASAWANAHCKSVKYYPRKLALSEVPA